MAKKLNSPPIYDPSMAIEGEKKSNVPFYEADLARIILSSVPVTWVNQCNMMHSMLPKSSLVLLPNLEAIEHVMNEKHQTNLKVKVKESSSASTSTKGSSKKPSTPGNPNEQVPK